MNTENLKSTLGNVSEIAKDFSAEALTKSKSLAENIKRTVKAEKLDYDISRKYIEIGKLVYAAYEDEGSYDHVADEICEEINALFDQIIAIKLGDEVELSEEEKEAIISEVNATITKDDEDVAEENAVE